MDRPFRPASLALPFAAIGLTGGWLTAHLAVSSSSSEAHIAWLLIIFTPLSCAFLGELVRDRPAAPRNVLSTVAATLVAGVVNGMMVGVFAGAFIGLVVGAVAGFLCALPFLPALCAVVATGRRVRSATVGSLVDAANRRAVWRTTVLSVALGVLLTGGKLPTAITVSALGVLLAITLADLSSLRRANVVGALTGQMVRREAERPTYLVTADARVEDLGVGDATFDDVVRSPDPYRENDRVVRVVSGEPAQAIAALETLVRRDVIATALTTGALLVQAFR